MFHKVLIGVDGRDGGRDAIALARDLGGARAQFVLANAVGGTVPGRAGSLALAASCRYAKALLDQERGAAGIAGRTITVCDGSPGQALHELAVGEGADLVVVGAGHRRHLSRLLLGDDALDVADRPPCAVAIAPAGYRIHPDGWQTIGVGDDGSALGDHALALGCELGRAHHATVRALSVIGPESLSYRELMLSDWSAAADRLEERRQTRLDAWRGVEARVTRGDPIELLRKLSDEVDLLIVGTRAQGPISRRLNGSASRRLAAGARCALLVLPPGFKPAAVAPVPPSSDPRALAAPGC